MKGNEMKTKDTKEKLIKAIRKELESVEKSEQKLLKKASAEGFSLKSKLEEKIPKGVNTALQVSFSKAFGFIFKNGIGVIEKSYDKESIATNYDISNYAVDRKGNRGELKRLRRSASKSDLLNISLTTVEGVGLGALGIGLPDIVLFIGMILRGIYEVSLRYGYDYESNAEKYLILKMMRASLSKNEAWVNENSDIDGILNSPVAVGDDFLQTEIEETAKAFATDMLVLKFIQGLPLVGVAGGVFNPVYYSKIMSYVRLKYYKRYLTDKLHEVSGIFSV